MQKETDRLNELNNKLEREHEDLLIENEEMRQTSLDSVEIANVLE
jgi:hypothetical protein